MNLSKLHILLVDDDEDDRMFFEEALEDLSLGTSFEYATNGIEALQRLKGASKLPHVVFLDLNMPLLSGSSCLKQIRACNDWENMKVVIYSTSFDPSTVNYLYENGANHYIRKPGAYEDLKLSIKNAINSLAQSENGYVSKDNFVINP